MSGKIEEFLKIQNKNSRVASSIFKKLCNLGYNDDFLEIYKDTGAIEQIILELRPSSRRSITTICYIIGKYANFIGNKKAYQIIHSIDRNLLWKKAKINASPKYLSHELYEDVLNRIRMNEEEETNALYYKTLFRVIYEGVYCDDMSVITNLRASDIHDDIVTLHTDEGYSYKIRLPENLIKDLKKLATVDKWWRRNRYASYSVEISGRYPDSCFKIQNIKIDSSTTYRFGYYNKLRKISKEYIGYNLPPTQLFISGIMYRICEELKNNDILIEEAFSEENRNFKVSNIITRELSRCEYDIPVKSLREQVIGHLEVFKI